MKLADEVIAWLFVVLGTTYCAFTPRPLSLNALWFFGNGLFLITIGFLNLTRIKYAGAAPGVRWLSLCANLVIVFFSGFVTVFSARPFGPTGVCSMLAVFAAIFAALPHGRRGSSPEGAA